MRFVVHCLDKPGALPLRLANYEAHKSYLAAGDVATVVSGPLLADRRGDDDRLHVHLRGRDEGRHRGLQFGRPVREGGVWGTVNIHPFLMRVDNRS